jgi:hypothetical protein
MFHATVIECRGRFFLVFKVISNNIFSTCFFMSQILILISNNIFSTCFYVANINFNVADIIFGCCNETYEDIYYDAVYPLEFNRR